MLRKQMTNCWLQALTAPEVPVSAEKFGQIWSCCWDADCAMQVFCWLRGQKAALNCTSAILCNNRVSLGTMRSRHVNEPLGCSLMGFMVACIRVVQGHAYLSGPANQCCPAVKVSCWPAIPAVEHKWSLLWLGLGHQPNKAEVVVFIDASTPTSWQVGRQTLPYSSSFKCLDTQMVGLECNAQAQLQAKLRLLISDRSVPTMHMRLFFEASVFLLID